jgi:hypothetical protein
MLDNDVWSEFHGPNAGYVLALYDRYRQDPGSVDVDARKLFERWTPEIPDGDGMAALAEPAVDKIIGAINLAVATREYGHLAAQIDPLGLFNPPGDPTLELAYYGLTEADLQQLPANLVGGPTGAGAADALEAIQTLRSVYSSSIGYDYDHLRVPEERNWLRHAAEDRRFSPLRLPYDPKGLLERLIEARPIFDGDQIRDLEVERKNRAKEIIEDFMIAANGVTARYLAAKKFPSIRRVVRAPKRWDRIVALAQEHGARLPANPDSVALDKFLVQAKAADPLHFPDLSLAVIKLLGAGEYVAEKPGGTAPGHFGLAVKDYAHSTAPNRRYTDLITQRLLKAAIADQPMPYSYAELGVLAEHLTKEEDAANKVEQQVSKSAAALVIESRIGEQFDALVIGASEKGTWVRLLTVPVEGKLMQGFEGLDIGDRIRVQLISTNVKRGFIDFKQVGSDNNNDKKKEYSYE